MNCSITNLGSCLPEKFFNYINNLINAPIEPITNSIQTLLSTDPSIALFTSLWAIILYLISLFYGLLFLYYGFNLMISGHSPEKRERAKSSIQKIIITMVLVQGSYFLYSLIIDLGSALSSSILNMIDPSFFNISIDMGLKIIYTAPYLVTLLATILILLIRYVIISVGLVLFPIAIFLYFIPQLHQYGKLLLNFLLTHIFVGFFASIVLLAFSMITDLFPDQKILIMTASFLSVISLIFFLCWFSIIKSVISNTIGVTGKVGAVMKIFGGGEKNGLRNSTRTGTQGNHDLRTYF